MRELRSKLELTETSPVENCFFHELVVSADSQQSMMSVPVGVSQSSFTEFFQKEVLFLPVNKRSLADQKLFLIA